MIVRSYSLNTAKTSDDKETEASGYCSKINSLALSSCELLEYEWINETAIADLPCDLNFRVASTIESSFRGSIISPSTLILPGISNISLGLTGRSGLIHELGFTSLGVP